MKFLHTDTVVSTGDPEVDAAKTSAQAQRYAVPGPTGVAPAVAPRSGPTRPPAVAPSSLAGLRASFDTNPGQQLPGYDPSVVAPMPTHPVRSPLGAQVVPEAPRAHRGHIVAMFSCRGGSGATTLSVNAAAILAKAGKSVCVVDLDLQLGDVFVALDLEAQTSLAAVAREASTIDGAALRRRMARHDSGVYALSQAANLEDVDSSLLERIPALMATLSDHFDYVIVDGIRDLGDYALGVLDLADDIVMVLTEDVPAVRRAGRSINLFRRLGYGDGRIRLLVNRSGGGDIGEDAVSRALSMPIAARVREDDKHVRAAIHSGSLLSVVAPGSKVVRDIEEFTHMLRRVERGPSRAIAEPPEKKSFFSFLRRGAK